MGGLGACLGRYLCGGAAAEGRKEVTVVLLGLDNAGKTSLMNTLQGKVGETTTPSWGFSTHKIDFGSLGINLYDLGGGQRIRKIWEEYLPETYGAIFVVDSADVERFPEAAEVLAATMADRHMSGKPVLLFANKQDLPAARSPVEVADSLRVAELKGSSIHIVGGRARTDTGEAQDVAVDTGLRWLTRQISTLYDILKPRVETDAEAQRALEQQRREERKRQVEAQREERRRQREEAENGIRREENPTADIVPPPGPADMEEAQKAEMEMQGTGSPVPPPKAGSPTKSLEELVMDSPSSSGREEGALNGPDSPEVPMELPGAIVSPEKTRATPTANDHRLVDDEANRENIPEIGANGAP